MIDRLKRLYRRYVKNEDIDERTKEVMHTLANGKQREGDALRSVAVATGDKEVERSAGAAEREAKRIRERLADDVALDVFSGSPDTGDGGRR